MIPKERRIFAEFLSYAQSSCCRLIGIKDETIVEESVIAYGEAEQFRIGIDLIS